MSLQLPARSAWAKGPPVRAPGAPSPQAQPSPPSTTTACASASHVSYVPPTFNSSPTSPSHNISPLFRIQQRVSPLGLPPHHPGTPLDPNYNTYQRPQWMPQYLSPYRLPLGPLGMPTPALPTSPPRGQQPPFCPSGTLLQPPTPQHLPSTNAVNANSGVNAFTPKRVIIRSESGKVLDLEEYRKKVPPRTHPQQEARRGKKMAKKARQKMEKARLGAEERVLYSAEGQPLRLEVDQAIWEVEGGKGISKDGEWEPWERRDEEDGDGAGAAREAKQQVSAVATAAPAEEVGVELPRAGIQELKRALAVDGAVGGEHDAVPELKTPLRSVFTSVKAERCPAPLDLQRRDLADLEIGRSALANSRPIEDISRVQYPEGVSGPRADLNVHAAPGRFRYDRDFLLQFMSICKDRPDALPPLDEIGINSLDQMSTSRGPHGSRASAGAPSCQPSTRPRSGPFAFRKSTTNPLGATMLDSYTTLSSRPPSKAQRSGDISQFGTLAKYTEPSFLWNQTDKPESPESMKPGEGSVDRASCSSENVRALAVADTQETEGSTDPLPASRNCSKRGGAQKNGGIVPCKTDPRVEDDSDDIFKNAFWDFQVVVAQEEPPRWSRPSRRMSDEEANERIDRTVTMLSGLHNITTALAVFGDLPARYHGRLVARLVSRGIRCNADAHAQVVAYFLHCAAERGLCSPTAFEDGVSMAASALEDIGEEIPDAVSRYATMIQGTGIHEDPHWRVRVVDKAGIRAPEPELKLLST